MNVVAMIPKASPCPVCGNAPDIDRCTPYPRGHGPVPWYAGCYGMRPEEHFVGINGDNQLDAIRLWNSEVDKIKRGDFESAGLQRF